MEFRLDENDIKRIKFHLSLNHPEIKTDVLEKYPEAFLDSLLFKFEESSINSDYSILINLAQSIQVESVNKYIEKNNYTEYGSYHRIVSFLADNRSHSDCILGTNQSSSHYISEIDKKCYENLIFSILLYLEKCHLIKNFSVSVNFINDKWNKELSNIEKEDIVEYYVTLQSSLTLAKINLKFIFSPVVSFDINKKILLTVKLDNFDKKFSFGLLNFDIFNKKYEDVVTSTLANYYRMEGLITLQTFFNYEGREEDDDLMIFFTNILFEIKKYFQRIEMSNFLTIESYGRLFNKEYLLGISYPITYTGMSLRDDDIKIWENVKETAFNSPLYYHDFIPDHLYI